MNAINCDGSHCVKHETEIRILPIARGNAFLCEDCFDFEMTFRRVSNRNQKTNYSILNWNQLKIFE